MLFWCIQIYQLLVVYIYLLIFVWKRIFHLISYSLTLTTLTTHKIVHSHFFFLALASLVDSAPPPKLQKLEKIFPQTLFFVFRASALGRRESSAGEKKNLTSRENSPFWKNWGGFFFFTFACTGNWKKHTVWTNIRISTWIWIYMYSCISISI